MELNKDQEDILKTFGQLKKTQKECTDLYNEKYPNLEKNIKKIIEKTGWNIDVNDVMTLISSASLMCELESLKKKADNHVRDFVNEPTVLEVMSSLLDKEKENKK